MPLLNNTRPKILRVPNSSWDEFVAALTPTSGEKILDIGAGKGSVASRVLQVSKGAEVYAIDPNGKKVEAIRLNFPAIKSSVAGAESLPFPDAFFDKAYTTLALHHFTDLDRALGEIARVLRPGGSFVILEVAPGSAKGMTFRIFGRIMGEHMNLMGEEQLSARLAAAKGLKVARSTKLGSSYLIQLLRI